MMKYVRKTAHELAEPDLLPISQRATHAELWDRQNRTSETPSSLGLVSRAHKNEVFIQMMDTRMRGMMSLFAGGLMAVAGLAAWTLPFLWMAMTTLLREPEGLLIFGVLALLVFMTLIAVISVVSAIRMLRMDIFGPKDVPLIFNRTTRKVYKFAQEVPMFPNSYNISEFISHLAYLPKYWIESLTPWPMILAEYDWDCIGAEYQQHTSLSGNVVNTRHHFNLHVRENPTSDRVIGLVTPMSPMLVGSRESAAALWEFIRRFMEEGGPVLYPGDKPSPPHPKNLLQAAQLVAPYYWVALVGYAAWTAYYFWQHGDNYSIAGSSFAQLSAEILAYATYGFLYFIVANWLAHKLGFDVELPEELMADAGAPLNLQELAREAAASTPK